MLFRLYICFIFCFSSLLAEVIDTFYGGLEVEEPVLLELIHSPAMQRLKEVHQYGVAYYTRTHSEEYNRYDHSLGVFAILRKNGASLEEQIAGLLHDISHTVFSHVGDWIFGRDNQEKDYQSIIYKIYLTCFGIEEILMKHGYTIERVTPGQEQFRMLEQGLPNLCADRLEYNLQGAYYQGFLTKSEVLALYEDFRFVNGDWIATKIHLLNKLAQFSIFMTRNCWGSPANYASSCWLAKAMIRGLEIGLLSWKEIHCGGDREVWDKLSGSDDPVICSMFYRLAHVEDYYRLVSFNEADTIVNFRCRAIDPWVLQDEKIIRLSAIDLEFAENYQNLQKKAKEGWFLQLY